MKEKIYAEIGFGNESFLSTEIEQVNREFRIKKFIIPRNIESLYFRVWILKKVFELSSENGFSITKKNKNKLKILFGISGNNKDDRKNINNKPL